MAVTNATTITLPPATSIAGRQYTIKNIDPAATVTVSSGGSLIDGAATQTLAAQYKYITVVSDGTDWFIVANN